MKCPHCGREIGEGSQFCVFCMTSLIDKKDSTPNFKKSKTTYVIIALSIYIIIMLAIGAYLLFFKGCNSDSKKSANGRQASSAMSSVGSVSALNSSANRYGADETENSQGGSVGSMKENYSTTQVSGDPTESHETSTSSEKTTTENQTTQNADVSSSKSPSEDSTSTQNTESSSKPSSSAVVSSENPKPTTCSHDWVAITKTVHHEEKGHYEAIEKAKKVKKYKCSVCYKLYSTLDKYYDHFEAHVEASGESVNFFKDRYEMVDDWDYYEEKEWVVDQEAYDEEVITGYECSKCKKTKN